MSSELASHWVEEQVSARLKAVEAEVRAEVEAKAKPPANLAGEVGALLAETPSLLWDAAVQAIARR